MVCVALPWLDTPCKCMISVVLPFTDTPCKYIVSVVLPLLDHPCKYMVSVILPCIDTPCKYIVSVVLPLLDTPCKYISVILQFLDTSCNEGYCYFTIAFWGCYFNLLYFWRVRISQMCMITPDVQKGWKLRRQLVGCWLGHPSFMGLLPVGHPENAWKLVGN